MSLRLTKPGMRSADLTGKIHPKTGESIKPIGYLPSGAAVWPVMGASPDDPDDPDFTGEGDEEDDDDEDEDDEDQDDKRKKRPVKKAAKSRKSSDDDEDDEDEDEDEDDRPTRPERQAARYRTRLRAQEKENRELKARLQALEDKDKKPDEVASRDLTEAQTKASRLTEQNRTLTAQLAFFSTPTGIEWVDPTDAFALAEREGLLDDVIDEDGNVDKRELRRGLRDLARRKKHLVKSDTSTKARGRKSIDDTEDDEEDEDEEPRSRKSTSTMNGGRKGSRGTGPTRASLAKKFPVLNKF